MMTVLAVIFTLGGVGTAVAYERVVVSGDYSAPYLGSIDAGGFPASGEYYLNFYSSASGVEGVYTIFQDYTYYHFGENGSYQWADDSPIHTQHLFGGTNYRSKININYLPDNVIYYPNGVVEELDYAGLQESTLDLTYGVVPTTGHYYFALSSVPEPASWSLMLIGVGALGGVLRNNATRRRTALPEP